MRSRMTCVWKVLLRCTGDRGQGMAKTQCSARCHAGTAFTRMARTTPVEHRDPGVLLESADAVKHARDLVLDRAARTSVAASGASAQDPRHIAAERASKQKVRTRQRGQWARRTLGQHAKSAVGAEGDEAAHCTPCDARDVPAEVAKWVQGVETDRKVLAQMMQTPGLTLPGGGGRLLFCSHEVARAYAEAGMPQELVWEGFMGSGRVSVAGPDRQSRVARSWEGTPMEHWTPYRLTVAHGKVVGRVTLDEGGNEVTVSSGTTDDAPMVQIARDVAVLLCTTVGVRIKSKCVHVITVNMLNKGLRSFAAKGWEFKSGVDVLLPLFMAASLKIGRGSEGVEGDPYNVAATAAARLLRALDGTDTRALWGTYQKAVVCSVLQQQGPGPDGELEFQANRFDMCLKEAYRAYGSKVRSGARPAE